MSGSQRGVEGRTPRLFRGQSDKRLRGSAIDLWWPTSRSFIPLSDSGTNLDFPSLVESQNVLVKVSPSETTLPSAAGPSLLRLVGSLPSTLSKRFFLLGSGKHTQRTAYTVRNHGSESFVAEETAESDALNLASSTKVQSPPKTRFGESDPVRKSEEICGQITQQPPTSRI